MDLLKNRRAQGLPLNTIVIAILVIIVLLVIIVFFTTKMSDQGDKINNQSNQATKCSMDNPAISGIYSDVEDVDNNCSEAPDGYTNVPGVNNCCGKR